VQSSSLLHKGIPQLSTTITKNTTQRAHAPLPLKGLMKTSHAAMSSSDEDIFASHGLGASDSDEKDQAASKEDQEDQAQQLLAGHHTSDDKSQAAAASASNDSEGSSEEDMDFLDDFLRGGNDDDSDDDDHDADDMSDDSNNVLDERAIELADFVGGIHEHPDGLLYDMLLGDIMKSYIHEEWAAKGSKVIDSLWHACLRLACNACRRSVPSF
jgi:hypothetical protein